MRPLISVLIMMLGLPMARSQEPRNTDPSELEVSAAQDAVQVDYLTTAPFQQVRSDFDYGVVISQNRDLVGSLAWLLDTDLRLVPRLRFNIGPKAYLAKLQTDNSGAFAVALSGTVRYELIRRLGISVFGSAAYAPHVLMFGSANNVTDFSAGAEIRFAPRLYALAGYRWFNYKFPGGVPDDRIENSLFAGLRWDINH